MPAEVLEGLADEGFYVGSHRAGLLIFIKNPTLKW